MYLDMKVLYVGNSKSIIRNLLELGVKEILLWSGLKGLPDVNGVVITKDVPPNEMEELKNLKVPIILSSGKAEYQKDVGVLVLDEDEMNVFCGGEWNIAKCRDQIRKLGIKHLVVSLSKKEVKQRIEQFYIPLINVQEVVITDVEVERAKDVITAIIGYIYIKDGLLMPDSIERAKVGAMLEISGMKKEEGYHLKFNLKRNISEKPKEAQPIGG